MAKYGDKNISGLSSLFGKDKKQGINPSKFLPSSSMNSLGNEVESADYIREELSNKQRVIPTIDFSRPENFAKYGSAKEYYKTSIERIYKTYPYDGSKKEKIQWSLSSSYLDNYIFETEYPRTNGYVMFQRTGSGGYADSVTVSLERYGLAATPQYINVKGGPNKASLPIYDQGSNKGTDFKNPDHKANFYDTANNREKNITINGETGNTIEFWFNAHEQVNQTRCFFDVWNNDGTENTQIESASYGRMMVESRFAGTPVDNALLHFTYMSGTSGGASRVPIFSFSDISFTTNTWAHFAITVENSGDETADKGLRIKTFLNGNLVDNILTGSSVAEVTGSSLGGINANINAYLNYPTEEVKGAALAESPSITNFNGFANNSGSVDELRFWKVARTEKQIGTNWFTQIGAGTNTDTSNTDLGFYFKFNEGIVGDSSVDQTILDYSGRVSNGTYYNYSTSTSRHTESAIVLAGAADREFKDPIIYLTHPSVSSYKTDAMQKGEEWDYRNTTLLFQTLPSWIQEEDGGSAHTLSQIMASYFDTLHLQIEEMQKTKTLRYLSSSINSGIGPKPLPFASKLLANAGFIAPEIFADTDVVASLTHRDDNREFERKLYDVKNYIYQNIYNNLAFINKSKGTTKSIRNLIRCFGVDEEIYKINMYADNAEYTLNNNFVDKTVRKTYADFNHVDRNTATVHTYKNSSESDSFGFITGSLKTSTGFDRGLAMTVESEIILPKKAPIGSPNYQSSYFGALTSSMFGMHSAKQDPGSDAPTEMTWDSNDYANFQVYAVSDTSDQDKEASKSVKFTLKSYNSVLPELTSSLYFDQYQDTKWNFAVRVKPKGYPNVSESPVITGSIGKEYDVEFEGYSVTSDIVLNHFLATGSISHADGENFITQKKRLYVGAHRTNFTGSVREMSDVLVSSCRYWADNIDSDELKSHAIDPLSYGVKNPEKNAYFFVTKYNPAMQVPRSKTLVLNWEFDTVTGSDGSGHFVVKDSSYTINQDEKFQQWDRGPDLSNLLESNHDARGFGFQANDTGSVSREYLQAYKQQLPENINNSNMVNVATTDDLTFTKNTLPVKFLFALEKSMYQTISEEMVNFFYASKQASSMDNLIGDPVNRYRINYKSMEKVRSLFFNTIGNTPDLEKYLNYYKWLDESVSKMVEQLVPVSANLPGVRNIVEDHMLDRSGKYQSKFPTLENKINDIESCTRGINELLYDWEHGHAPLSPDALTNQDENCFWWNKRALRDEAGLSSGDADLDSSKRLIHSASVQVLNRTLCSPIRLDIKRLALRQDLNKKQIIFAETPPGTSETVSFNTTTFSDPVTCDDTSKINPQFKFKPQFKVEGDLVGSRFQGQMVSPVVFYSASATDQNTDPTGYYKTTQHLQDYYVETKDIPMQGTFTETHVGGYQYRHSGLNAGLASGYGGRREGWHTTTSSVGGETYFVVYSPSGIDSAHPRASYSRDHIAKSYVNIKNIKNVTSSNDAGVGTTDDTGAIIPLGNYSSDYEIVQIPGRSINNKYFVENSGIGTASVESTHISGLYDRAIPDRGQNKYVFVNRFSAPGGPDTLGAGYLDVESESFSVYNALPFRNLAVRSPLRTLLTKHSAFGGYDSVLGEPSASFHKTQRNGAKRLEINGQPDAGSHDGLGLNLATGTVFDNAFIQHAIPKSDMQYMWVTASATNSIFGYQKPDNSLASMASTDITFLTASLTGAHQDSGEMIPVDFVGLNSNVKNTLVTGSNRIQRSANTDLFSSNNKITPELLLNSQNLNSNGPSGFSSWKQVRQSYNPLVRDMKKYNRISLLKVTASSVTLDNGQTIKLDQNVLHSYTEPLVSSKYKPIFQQLQLFNYKDSTGLGLDGDKINIKSSYGNNLVYFTLSNTRGIKNVLRSMTEVMNFNPTYESQSYDHIKRIYLNSENDGFLLGLNPVKKASLISYREVVYPKESFTFLKKTRMREYYGEASGSDEFNRPLGTARTFWRDVATDRLRSIGFASNSFGTPIEVGTFKTTSYENVIDLSCWPLEANYPVVDIAPTNSSDGTIGAATSTGEGEGSLNLPTTIGLKSRNGELSYGNWIYNLYRVPMQGLASSEPSTLSSSSPPTASLSYEYPNFALSGSDPNQASVNYTIAHMSLIPEWTANLTSSRNPWFDSYEEYSNDIRRIGKDFTVLPEFKISEHMEYYLNKGLINGKFSGLPPVNLKYLDLPGATLGNTSSATTEDGNSADINKDFYKIYSHSDFLKHFEVIREDHVDSETTADNHIYYPSKIKLKCKAIKKLLPYQGFYPALRTVQLGQMFSSSFAPYTTGSYDKFSTGETGHTEAQKVAALIQPFFAPGIMFNTIKSGIAVDWPVITASVASMDPPAEGNGVVGTYGYRAGGVCNFEPHWRIPFEALYAPNEKLPSINENQNEGLADRPDAKIYHIWNNYMSGTGDFLSQSSHARRYSVPGVSEEHNDWWRASNEEKPSPNFAWNGQFKEEYNLAMNNFLAETVDFFLHEGKLTNFVSKPQKDFKTMRSGTVYQMDVVLRKTDGFKMYEGPDRLFLNETYNSSSTTSFTASVGSRGMHYGPYFASNGAINGAMGEKQEIILKQLADPGNAPYTPPYFYGDAIARIAFRPHIARPEMGVGESDKFTLSEIFAAADIQTYYFNRNQNSNGVFEYKKVKDPVTGEDVYGLENFASGTAAYRNQMQLDSSMNLFSRFAKKNVSYVPSVDPVTGEVKFDPTLISDSDSSDNENDRWIMETKFECPVLDFSDHNILTTYSNGDGNERQLTAGMWKTFGSLPQSDEGIILEIRDSAPQLVNATKAPAAGQDGRAAPNPITGEVETRGPARIDITTVDGTFQIETTGSLIDVCGFNTKPPSQRIGTMANSKKISEAIVAIPFNSDGSHIKISKESFNMQLMNLKDHGVAVKAGDVEGLTVDIPETSISDMIKKMKKFIIPPQFDFLNNLGVRNDPNMGPFVMYIFDFSHELSRKDLSLIWQNMMPDISVTAEEETATIQHSVLTGDLDFFGVDPKFLLEQNAEQIPENRIFPKDMRWKVFKVKQRAKNNYEAIQVSKNGQNFGFDLELDDLGTAYTMKSGFEKDYTYSYNWPYDFFSLVELAKIETDIRIKPRKLKPTIEESEESGVDTATADYPGIVLNEEINDNLKSMSTPISMNDKGGMTEVDKTKTPNFGLVDPADIP